MDLEYGKIGRFEIDHEAAAGGAGRIFRARDPETGQPVAVKVIHFGSALPRFEREAQILAQIVHPGVVRYIEHGAAGTGEAYLAMEWLEGEDVRERLARAGLTMSETVTLGRRVAEALVAVHAHDLVHRDIKPANLFLPGGVVDDVKIIDFGLARGDESMGLTQTGAVVGTPSYMAPEQARGQGDLDARADIYSLGCVLYKALTGHAPFESKDIMAVLAKVLFEEPPRVSEQCLDVPPALDDLVMRMLAKDPSARPATASAVARELAALDPLGTAGEARPSCTSHPPSGLMVGEQRMVAMLLIGASEINERVAGAAVEALVHEHGGRLDRLLDGTRIVAVVGSEVATDQAARAARCALALRAVLPGAPMVLATGRSEMTPKLPVGAAVDRAARMLRQRLESSTLPSSTITIDAVTAALLDPRFDVQSSDDGPCLRGLRELEGGARTLLGRETPFVGREWELSSVRALFRQTLDEPLAVALLVTAPPGMGKTRLAREAVRALVAEHPDVQVWMGRGDPLRARSTLDLLAQVIRSACGVQDDEPIEERRRKIRRRTALRLPPADAPRAAEILGEMAGAPLADDIGPELRAARRDPHVMSAQMRRVFGELLAAECAVHPVLIVLEDLHWSDPATARFFDDALKHLGHRSWMVIALARPEVFDAFPLLWKERNMQLIRLNPLPRRASERLVREVLGDDASAATAARLVATADGNAFYLEELIRAVAARGAPADDNPTLPETVLAMVQTRLEGLDAGARRLLRAASVFGEVFWAGGVLALLGAGSEPAPSEGWVDVLVAREVLVRRAERRFAGEEAVAFRHALLREGAYAMLTERDRALGHELAGEWLERNGESDPIVLARHFELGLAAARAGGFYLRAAQQALHGMDLDAALEHADRALASGLPQASQILCLGVLSEVHSWRSEWERSAAYAAQVTRLAEPGSDPWIKGATAQHTAAFRLGRLDDFMGTLTALMSVDPAPEVVSALLDSLYIAFLVTCLLSRFTVAEGVLARVTSLARSIGDHDPLARGCVLAGHAYWEAWVTGDLWAALGHMEAASADFDAAGDTRHAQYSRASVGMIQWNLGRLAEAERVLRDPAGDADDHLIALTRSLYRTLVLIDRGALDDARDLARRRIEIARRKPQGQEIMREVEGRWLLGEIAYRRGDLEAADREITAAAAALPALTRQLATTTLAAVRLRLGRVDEAVALGRELLDAVAAHGGVGQRAGRIRLVYAEALHASGDDGAARAVLAAARRELLAKAGRITDAEGRQRFLDDLPEHRRTLALAAEWGA